LIGYALARGRQLGQRDDLVHEADAFCLFGREALARERVAANLPDADCIVELRDDDAGHQSPARFRNREKRVVSGDYDVASCDDAGAAAKTCALHQRNQ
jgi:hypothetical protein